MLDFGITDSQLLNFCNLSIQSPKDFKTHRQHFLMILEANFYRTKVEQPILSFKIIIFFCNKHGLTRKLKILKKKFKFLLKFHHQQNKYVKDKKTC